MWLFQVGAKGRQKYFSDQPDEKLEIIELFYKILLILFNRSHKLPQS